jgi:hypothetical protein
MKQARSSHFTGQATNKKPSCSKKRITKLYKGQHTVKQRGYCEINRTLTTFMKQPQLPEFQFFFKFCHILN